MQKRVALEKTLNVETNEKDKEKLYEEHNLKSDYTENLNELKKKWIRRARKTKSVQMTF